MTAQTSRERGTLHPFLVTIAAVALLSLMDAFMKGASLAIGAYSALLLRSLGAATLVGTAWIVRRGDWPQWRVLRVHMVRGVVIAAMALTFFSGLVYLPLAEAIALSFISPLVALALAALILKEKIGRSTILAAVLGVAGVAIIIGGRVGRERMTEEATLGFALVLVSALFYAWNLILQRQQALLARPVEIVAFQNAVVALVLLPAAPWFLQLPDFAAAGDVAISCLLSVSSAMGLSWAYARAEAQLLVPVEYTAFAWAALFGWMLFGEGVQVATMIGALLIILGCWIAAPRRHPEPTAV